MNVRTRLLALVLLATASVCWLSGCDDKKKEPEHPPGHKDK